MKPKPTLPKGRLVYLSEISGIWEHPDFGGIPTAVIPCTSTKQARAIIKLHNTPREELVGRVSRNDWARGYFCALALVLKANYGVGVHSPDIMEFFKSGGDYRNADPEDIATFRRHGLIK